ncbi:MAG: response regulator, partial [Deltaproteobacteria bacterium]|nr:response regulator [Deltaproteobacteria bacterium]
LEQAGLKVTIAENGQKGVEAVETHDYDLVLMDIQMPVMDGYQAAREIRRTPRFNDLPIIAMTASAMTQDRTMAMEAGMNGHVSKPINTEKLFSAMLKWIKYRSPEPVGGPSSPAVESDRDRAVENDIPTLARIDVAAGLKRVGGNKKLYRSILLKFYNEYPDSSARIKAAFDAGDRELAQRLAHTVKGVAGNIGAEVLFQAGEELEAAIKQGRDDIAGPLATFEEDLQAVLQALAGMAPPQEESTPDKTDPTADSDSLLLFLEKLEPLVRKRSPKPIKAAMEEAACLLWPEQYRSDMARLSNLINKYKFNEMAELLTSLRDRLQKEQ